VFADTIFENSCRAILLGDNRWVEKIGPAAAGNRADPPGPRVLEAIPRADPRLNVRPLTDIAERKSAPIKGSQSHRRLQGRTDAELQR
jgi:hypothetical protein